MTATTGLGSELQQFVRERLAEYKRPRWVVFLPALPKTATGNSTGQPDRESWRITPG